MSDANPAVASSSLRSRLHEKLPEIIIEATFLALAVLVAFAIDAWRVERQQKSDARVAVASIRAELKENQASVMASLPGLRNRLAAIAPLIDSERKSARGNRIKIGFVLAKLSTASWTMALNNQSLAQAGSKQSTELA